MYHRRTRGGLPILPVELASSWGRMRGRSHDRLSESRGIVGAQAKAPAHLPGAPFGRIRRLGRPLHLPVTATSEHGIASDPGHRTGGAVCTPKALSLAGGRKVKVYVIVEANLSG